MPTSPQAPIDPTKKKLPEIPMTSEEKGETILRSTGGFIFEVIKVVLIALAIIVPVRYFLIQPFYVKGASMEPNFEDNEYLIINEISYRFSNPKRGDIVVFRYPNDPSQFFIKRVIALPGERIEIANGAIQILNSEHQNGFVLDESSYLAPDVRTTPNVSMTLGPDEYFVMGDNRPSSLDSRRFGSITRDAIVGKTWIRAWPIEHWTVFENADYSGT